MSQRAPYHRPKEAPPAPPAEDLASLVEKHRERVLDLESRSYLPLQISSITKLPIAVVERILTTKAPPKRGTP